MWTCPVCDQKNTGTFCGECGFDRSLDYESFPSLQKTIPPTAAISSRRSVYRASVQSRTQPQVSNCLCCGKPLTGPVCAYCKFEQSTLEEASRYAQKIVAQLQDFNIVTYRYAWSREHSRLEYTDEELLPLGNAGDFLNKPVWADREFAQIKNGVGTELILKLSYRFRGNEKVRYCRIPTLKSDSFWKIGISLDRSLELRLYLGSQKHHTTSAPLELDLS